MQKVKRFRSGRSQAGRIPTGMHQTIIKSSLLCGGVGIPGAFAAHADLPAISAIWVGMFARLAAQAGLKLQKADVAKIVTALVMTGGTFYGAVSLGTTYFAWSGIGTPLAVACNSSANFGVTYLVGRAVAKVFLEIGPEAVVDDIVKHVLALFFVKAGKEKSHFPGEAVRIHRQSAAVTLEPLSDEWGWLDRLAGKIDEDFAQSAEENPPPQDRPAVNDLFR